MKNLLNSDWLGAVQLKSNFRVHYYYSSFLPARVAANLPDKCPVGFLRMENNTCTSNNYV